jgi:hypothetical protein
MGFLPVSETPTMDERHYIFGTQPQELTETKEVKMRLPIAHLIRLHGLKLLSGQNISETVTKALEVFGAFEEFWEKRTHEGKVSGRDAYLERSGRGMSVVRGDSRDLIEVTESDEYLDTMDKAILVTEGIESRIMYTGASLERILTSYANAGRSLGFI